VRRQRQDLAGMAAHLRVVEDGREVSLDQRWNSKFAELLTAQGAERPTRRTATPPTTSPRRASARPRAR